MEIKLITKNLQKFAFTMLTILLGIVASAQEAVTDSKVSTSTTTTTTEEWYTNPTYIIIGAILFIVLVAVLVRGGRGKRD